MRIMRIIRTTLGAILYSGFLIFAVILAAVTYLAGVDQ